MRLRSYLRGIGIGILIAAGICICANMNSAKGKSMTDEEIKARARELGMTEETVLTDLSAEPTTSVVEIIGEDTVSEEDVADATEVLVPEDQAVTDEQTESEEASSEEAVVEVIAEPTPEATPEPTPEATPEPTKEPEAQTGNTGDYVTITVEKGNGSDSVAKKLEAAGLVSNAHEYDVWLMQNGYDRIIAAGTHKIPKGASNEEIAKILCNR